jgi:hypothetical protein
VQAGKVATTGGDEALQLVRGQRGRLSALAAMGAEDAAERDADGAMARGPVEPAQAVLLADDGQPALESGAAVEQRLGGEIGGNRSVPDGQQRAASRSYSPRGCVRLAGVA